MSDVELAEAFRLYKEKAKLKELKVRNSLMPNAKTNYHIGTNSAIEREEKIYRCPKGHEFTQFSSIQILGRMVCPECFREWVDKMEKGIMEIGKDDPQPKKPSLLPRRSNVPDAFSNSDTAKKQSDEPETHS